MHGMYLSHLQIYIYHQGACEIERCKSSIPPEADEIRWKTGYIAQSGPVHGIFEPMASCNYPPDGYSSEPVAFGSPRAAEPPCLY